MGAGIPLCICPIRRTLATCARLSHVLAFDRPVQHVTTTPSYSSRASGRTLARLVRRADFTQNHRAFLTNGARKFFRRPFAAKFCNNPGATKAPVESSARYHWIISAPATGYNIEGLPKPSPEAACVALPGVRVPFEKRPQRLPVWVFHSRNGRVGETRD